MNLMGKLWDDIRLTFTSGMFLALQMWRFDVFPLPLFFLMTGWTEWHFILFLTSTKTLCKKETMAGCKPQSIFRADTAQTLFEMYNYYEINILFLSDISADFFPSESLMPFHFPLTKSKTSSWTLQRSSFRRFGNKQNVIWTHDQERQVSVSTSKQPPQSREGSTVSALLMTSSRREPTGQRQTHSIGGKMALWASCRVLSGCDFKVQVETGEQKETHTCFYL